MTLYVQREQFAVCVHRKKRVVVSLGHSMATLDIAEQGVRSGASLITHLFNAMLPVSGQWRTV